MSKWFIWEVFPVEPNKGGGKARQGRETEGAQQMWDFRCSPSLRLIQQGAQGHTSLCRVGLASRQGSWACLWILKYISVRILSSILLVPSDSEVMLHVSFLALIVSDFSLSFSSIVFPRNFIDFICHYSKPVFRFVDPIFFYFCFLFHNCCSHLYYFPSTFCGFHLLPFS